MSRRTKQTCANFIDGRFVPLPAAEQIVIALKMAPALATGNTIVIEPSEETPDNAANVAAGGMPAGVFNIVYGRGASVGHALATHPGIGMVGMTGSVEAGVEVMQAAAQNLTNVSFGVGGKAPALVPAFTAKPVQAMKRVRNGDPLKEDGLGMGPLIKARWREKVKRWRPERSRTAPSAAAQDL